MVGEDDGEREDVGWKVWDEPQVGVYDLKRVETLK